jgi:GNAT superfamily N-acetyltransferase
MDGYGVGYAMAAMHERTEDVYVPARRWCELEELGVASEWRHQGVGSALVGAVRAHAKAQGLVEMALTVWDFNEGARRFFETMGFRPITHRLELCVAP